ncbi:MAG: hypothetical protein JNL45_10100 [Hyphomicrobium sp.]|nr:hypothetical protein [Hyphomicrobium sp.]
MTPDPESIVPLFEVVLYALLNPALIGVAFFTGRKADEPAKLMIAAFAGAVAGFVLLYIAAWIGVLDAPRVARAAAGVFVLSLLTGLAYAWIGFRTRRGRE